MKPIRIHVGIPKLTGRRQHYAAPGAVPVNPRTGLGKPILVPGGGLAGATRTVWGHVAVTGRLNEGSLAEFATQTILGALQAATKRGGTGMIEVIAKMASQAIVRTFEEELRRARIEAFEAGVKVGAAEALARERASRAAAEGARTIFPRARHYIAKQEQAEGVLLAQSLQQYHGGTLADLETRLNVGPRPVHSISGWVQLAGLVEGQLAIQFRGSHKSGGPVVCVYPNGGGLAALESLLAAPSAGKWVHRHVYRDAYMLGMFSGDSPVPSLVPVRPSSGSAAAAALVAARAE